MIPNNFYFTKNHGGPILLTFINGTAREFQLSRKRPPPTRPLTSNRSFNNYVEKFLNPYFIAGIKQYPVGELYHVKLLGTDRNCIRK